MDSGTLHLYSNYHSAQFDSARPEVKLADYQKNMKLFVKSVEKQMSSIIDKYEAQIKELKSEIERLRKQLQKKGMQNTGIGLGIESHISECFSPIKHKGSSILGGETIRSNFFEQSPMKNLFETESQFFGMTQSKVPDYKFDMSKTNEKLNKSRFEMESRRQKQRQQDLLHFLEMGKSNLDINTDKMFDLVGKSKNNPQKGNRAGDNQEEDQQNQEQINKKKLNQSHNQSLNSICESLNNSFHGRRAQEKSAKKRKEQESKQQQENRRENQRQKFKKEQGIKNLLNTMRKNISCSHGKPEIIKGSKLLTTGEKGKSVQISSKSKVMINPVPVDLNKIKKQQHNSITTSPSKNPKSILKNSTTNFLTKSIENLSAISFHSSGGQQ